MKLIKILIFVCCLFTFVNASDVISKVGTTAGTALKIGVGTRAIGMGGAFTAVANDASAMYWNPGGVAMVQNKEVEFNHTSWIKDVNNDFLGLTVPVQGLGSLGVFVSTLTMDEMEVTTVDKPDGTGEMFDAGTLVVGLHYSRMLTDNFSIGFNAKYIQDKIWHMTANGFAMDIGVLYRIPLFNEFRIGSCISNYGTKMQLEGRDNLYMINEGGSQGNRIPAYSEMEKWDLPLTFRFGVAADVIKNNENLLTVALDAVHPNDNAESLNLGAEYTWNDLISIRTGYKSLFLTDTEEGLTFGLGVNYSINDYIKLRLNYAYEDFGILKKVQYFSVGLAF